MPKGLLLILVKDDFLCMILEICTIHRADGSDMALKEIIHGKSSLFSFITINGRFFG